MSQQNKIKKKSFCSILITVMLFNFNQWVCIFIATSGSLLMNMLNLLRCCRFNDSLEKADKLCKLTVKRKRGRYKNGYQEPTANFPTAKELSHFDEETLRAQCKLGLRAPAISKFVKDVANGKINLLDFEKVRDGDELYRKLRKIEGIGDFTACNVLMCMGFYHRVPVDSETVRHIKQVRFNA